MTSQVALWQDLNLPTEINWNNASVRYAHVLALELTICPITNTSNDLAWHLWCHRTASVCPCHIRTALSAFFVLPLTLVIYMTAVAHVDMFHGPVFNPSPLASAQRSTHANIDPIFPSLCILLMLVTISLAHTWPSRITGPFTPLLHLGQTPNLHIDLVSTLH